MNYIDMFILVLLIYAVFKGYTRGFIMQITLLIALLLGIFAAVKFSGITADFLDGRISTNKETLNLISLGITFALVFIGVNLAGRIAEKMIESADMSFINRLAGVALSLAKTIILTGILLAYIDRIDNRIPVLPKYTREHSLFYKPFANMARTLFPSLKVSASQGDTMTAALVKHQIIEPKLYICQNFFYDIY